MEFDVLVRGGTVFDGSNTPPIRADLGISGERIAAIGDLGPATGALVVEAAGLAVTPGFIDSHTHSDMACFLGEQHLDVVAAGVRQGVTTEVCGNCGFSPFPAPPGGPADLERHLATLFGSTRIEWTDLEGYRSALQSRGLIGNLAPLVGHGSLRAAVVGFAERPADNQEIGQMTRLLDVAMEQGAVGLSSGLVYMPGSAAGTDEVVALARSAASHGRVYTSHIRGETDMVADAVAEAIDIGRRTQVPVHISHHKVCGRKNWGRTAETLRLIDSSRRAGIDVTTDAYPYTAASTLLYAILPGWVQAGGVQAMLERLPDRLVRARIRDQFDGESAHWQNIPRAAGWDGIVISYCPGDSDLEGHSIAELAADAGTSPSDYVFDLLVKQRAEVVMIAHMMDEADVRRVLAYEGTMIGSDGIPLPGKPHPRWAGSFSRVLGRYCREGRLFGMPEAVHKMTAMTADRFGLKDRGRLARGCFADVVIFDPGIVSDQASYEAPLLPPTGVEHVFINGRHVIKEGALGSVRPGRVLIAS